MNIQPWAAVLQLSLRRIIVLNEQETHFQRHNPLSPLFDSASGAAVTCAATAAAAAALAMALRGREL